MFPRFCNFTTRKASHIQYSPETFEKYSPRLHERLIAIVGPAAQHLASSQTPRTEPPIIRISKDGLARTEIMAQARPIAPLGP
jgi:ribosomal protein S10